MEGTRPLDVEDPGIKHLVKFTYLKSNKTPESADFKSHGQRIICKRGLSVKHTELLTLF